VNIDVPTGAEKTFEQGWGESEKEKKVKKKGQGDSLAGKKANGKRKYQKIRKVYMNGKK